MALLTRLKRKFSTPTVSEIEPLSLSALDLYRDKKMSVERCRNQGDGESDAFTQSLEAIYSLENVDPSTIKVMAPPPGSKENEEDQWFWDDDVAESCQLELSLGAKHENSILSFTLCEPIYVLSLPETLESALLALGKETVGDLVLGNWELLARERGCKQGDINEVKEMLAAYLAGKNIGRVLRVDMAAWLRSLIPLGLKAKSSLLLARYGLEELIPLTTKERISLKKLPPESKQTWADEALTALRTGVVKAAFFEKLSLVVDTFVAPWVRDRDGVARDYEIVERMEKISEEPRLTNRILPFFEAVYGDQGPLLAGLMPLVAEGVYSVDATTHGAFLEVETMARSYCYSARCHYTLEELVAFVARELAMGWEGYTYSFIEKVLRCSRHLCIHKGEGGSLVIFHR